MHWTNLKVGSGSPRSRLNIMADPNPFEIQRVTNRKWREIVVPRRPMNDPLPFRDKWEALRARQVLFDRLEDVVPGIDPFRNQLCYEGPSRPVPHAFHSDETKELTELFVQWLPRVISFIKPQLEPPYQTFNPVSRVGWPYFDVPDKSQRQQIVEEYADRLAQGVSTLEQEKDGYITAGIRIQTEMPDKKREYLFLQQNQTDASIYSAAISPSGQKREDNRAPNGFVVPGRIRLVFLPSPWNLIRQTLDTAWHKVQLSYPSFHHNMYDREWRLPPEYKYVYSFDVKHFERHTAACARARGLAIGGMYGELTRMYMEQPFLVPSADWRYASLLHVRRDAGFSEQFASGFSEVAPLQKDIFMVLYAQFGVERFGMSQDEALRWAVFGGDSRLYIKNYGDDNIVFSERDPKVFDELMTFLQRYIHAEEETPTKFLGMLYNQEERRFFLPPQSYVIKTYIPERGASTVFRKAPCLGWVLKREAYSKFGLPIMSTIFEIENDVLSRELGLEWEDIIKQSVVERLNHFRRQPIDDRAVLDRDWMIPEEEKYKTGNYVGFPPAKTAPILKALLGD